VNVTLRERDRHALGVERVVQIDTTGAPGFGFQNFKAYDFLKDHEVVLTFDDGPWPGNTPRVLKALADRLAEAFAEHLHARVRREFWGYAADERLDNDALIEEAYRGIRPAPGYPACPDHTEKAGLFALLAAPENAHMQLTESFAMLPTASVSGFYFSHPESGYFAVGKIGEDQVADYARRKGIDVREAERWLALNVVEEPASTRS